MSFKKNISVVLANPLYGGNIGAVCRAMGNTDFSNLRIATKQKDLIKWKDAQRMAKSGSDILNSAQFFLNLNEAIGDCHAIFATTARKGSYRRDFINPRELASKISTLAATQKVALLFGPEDRGLSNEELSLAKELVLIPSSSRGLSYNLAQAVLICLYEIYLITELAPSDSFKEGLSLSQKEQLFEIWEETLTEMDFMKEEKRPHIMLQIKRILNRGCQTAEELNLMMAVAKKARLKYKRDLKSLDE